MLLNADTLDLVQHVDTVLDAVEGHELAPQVNAELMQSVLEIATPVCHTAADVDRQLRLLRGYIGEVASLAGPALRLGRHAPVHPLRAPADHRARPLPRTSSTSSSTSPAAS